MGKVSTTEKMKRMKARMAKMQSDLKALEQQDALDMRQVALGHGIDSSKALQAYLAQQKAWQPLINCLMQYQIKDVNQLQQILEASRTQRLNSVPTSATSTTVVDRDDQFE